MDILSRIIEDKESIRALIRTTLEGSGISPHVVNGEPKKALLIEA